MTSEHKPTTEEAAGMAWWNALPDRERTHWAKRAGTGVAADAWSLQKASQYRPESPELRAVVASAKPAPKHTTLMKAVRAVPGFSDAKLARVEDLSAGSYLSTRKVVRADGTLVHTDHEQWLAAELDADGRHAGVTRRRLAALDLRLSKCCISTLRVIVDHGGDQANLTQATVEHRVEAIDCRLFDAVDGWGAPRHLRDLISECQGPQLALPERLPLDEPAYRLRDVVDVGAFVRVGQSLHRERYAANSRRVFRVIEDDGHQQQEQRMTGAQLDPDGDLFPCRERRLFNDWDLSSAGRSGARLCDHWTFQLSDGIDENAERYLSFVPEWTATRKLAKLETRNLNDYQLFGKLQALDERVGVPFGWYFFMLHGNRVRSVAGERVLEAAEAGRIVLPEHDYRVLKNWARRAYGF